MSRIRVAVLAAICLLAGAPQLCAQGASSWFLAEGANNATFAEEILVGNPSGQALQVSITLLPQSDAIAPTLTKTVDLNILAFGDEHTLGAGVATAWPRSLENRLEAFQKDIYSTSGSAAQSPTGQKALQFGEFVKVTNGGVSGECTSATGSGCTAVTGRTRFPALVDQVAAANASDAFDAVIFASGVNDVEANISEFSAADALRTMVTNAKNRKISILMTKWEETSIGSLNATQVKALGDAIWGVTTDTSLGAEIYRQSLYRVQTSGGTPTQAGHDQISSDLLTKVAREFPLQPCDRRNDKPGKGCPLNP